jgi:hypothetical protein
VGENMLIFCVVVCGLLNAKKQRGLAWPWNYEASWFSAFSDTRIDWYYNWEWWEAGGLSSIEHVYMHRVIDDNDNNPSKIPERINNRYYNNPTKPIYFLGFNEPDYADQANMSPQDASLYYHTYIVPLRNSGKIYKLGSPGITNNGWTWLDNFMTLCSDCSIDFIAYHWYGNDFQHFKNVYINATRYNLPIWLTEWAPTNWNIDNPLSDVQINTLFNEILEYLDEEPLVERYAYFSTGPLTNWGITKSTHLLNDDYTLTALGKIYVADKVFFLFCH